MASRQKAAWARAVGTLAIAGAWAGAASASTVTYNPAPTTSTGWNPCGAGIYPALAGKFCLTTAFFEPTSLSTEFKNNPGKISVIFGAGFNSWNTRNNVSYNPLATTPQGWTLSFGGDPGGTLNVSIATALQFNSVTRGGARIMITPNAALLMTLQNAVTADNAAAPVGKKDYKITWAQALYDNFTITPPATGPAYYEMDVSGFVANMAGQDPAYCASFKAGCPPPAASFNFRDTPKFRYLPLGQPQAFFFGNEYIAIESLDNKQLIVYDGVDYGWHNYVSAVGNGPIPVPEPATWALVLAGFAGIGGALRRRRPEPLCAGDLDA